MSAILYSKIVYLFCVGCIIRYEHPSWKMFFSFPNDEHLRDKWIVDMKRD